VRRRLSDPRTIPRPGSNNRHGGRGGDFGVSMLGGKNGRSIFRNINV